MTIDRDDRRDDRKHDHREDRMEGFEDDFERGFEERSGKKGFASFARKKPCKFCTDEEYVIDYKNVRVLQSFMSEYGKIVPRRISGCCASCQRKLTQAIKRARHLALVGFVTSGPVQ